MDINVNLLKCALNMHTYNEPIKNETTQKLVKICRFCGKCVTSLNDYKFEKLEQRKLDIIEAIKNDSFIQAKDLIDDLFKDFGY